MSGKDISAGALSLAYTTTLSVTDLTLRTAYGVITGAITGSITGAITGLGFMSLPYSFLGGVTGGVFGGVSAFIGNIPTAFSSAYYSTSIAYTTEGDFKAKLLNGMTATNNIILWGKSPYEGVVVRELIEDKHQTLNDEIDDDYEVEPIIQAKKELPNDKQNDDANLQLFFKEDLKTNYDYDLEEEKRQEEEELLLSLKQEDLQKNFYRSGFQEIGRGKYMTLSVDNCVEILNNFFKQYEDEEKKIKQVVLDVAKTAWKKHGGYGIYGMFSTQHTQREDEVDTLIKNLESSDIDQWMAIKSLGRQGHWNKTGYGLNSYSSYNTKFMLYLMLEVCKIMEETTIGEIITKSPHKFEEIAQLVFNRLDTLIAKKTNKITEPDTTFLNYKDVLNSQTDKLTYD